MIHVERGDGWLLFQGESLTILKGMNSASVGGLITDAPYSSGGLFKGDRAASPVAKYQQGGVKLQRPELLGDNRDQRSWTLWCTLWLSECWRLLTEGAPVCLFTDRRMLPATTDALQAAGFVWRGIVAWDKGLGTRPQPGRFRNQAEYIVWGSKGPMPLDRKAPVLAGSYTIPVRQVDKFHLTGKPTELMRNLVRICEPGSLILDPFCGSGTTVLAAIMEGYEAIGIELGLDNYRVAVDRLKSATLEAAQ